MGESNVFRVGDLVQVLSGVKDTEYHDLTLGGWVGKIIKVEEGQPTFYLIEWHKETLRQIHPVYKKRSECDGLVLEQMNLDATVLTRYLGGPIEPEPQTRIKTKPLSQGNQEDRVRMVMSLTKDDPLPNVTYACLVIYREYLEQNLKFTSQVTVRRETRYGDFGENAQLIGMEDEVDESYGVICRVQLGRGIVEMPVVDLIDADVKQNRRILQDYRYWFSNHA